MQVEFALYGTVRDAVGEKTLVREFPEGTTVGAALRDVAEDHPDVRSLLFDGDGDLRSNVNVLVDETNVRDREGAETPLTDGAAIDVTPSVAGGSVQSRRSVG